MNLPDKPCRMFGPLTKTGGNNLDFLRFFFATLVLFSHCFPMVMGSNQEEPLFRLTGGALTLGSVAVAGFFTISGFLITQSWQRSKRPADYFRKRLLRIYPGWTASLIVCLLLLAPASRGDFHLHLAAPKTAGFFAQLALRHNGVGLTLPGVFARNPLAGMVDGPTWTIPFEIICYLLVAALGTIGLLRRPVFVLIATSVLLLWLTVPKHPYWSNIGPAPVIVLPYLGTLSVLPLFAVYFLAGSTFYVWRDRIPSSRPLAWVSGIVLLAAMAAAPKHGFRQLLFLALPIAGTYGLFSVAFTPTLRLQDFGRRCDLSYGLYLYGWPIQQLLVQYTPAFHGYGYAPPLLLFLVAFPLSLGAAALSWRFVEQRFLRLKPQATKP